MLIIAGPRITIKSAGKMNKISGNINFTGILAAISSAL
jgi:hypothetical protein